ncbi:uncharacterized protein LOC110846178 [Folsomia candida]|nr:uncharacterized protein LOC110846178 [Folsomia candida]
MSNKLEQYDVSPKELRNIQERAKIRADFRKEFVKQFTNPHRHGEGGYLFDPALQRWQSLKAQQYYYFKPTSKTIFWPILVVSTCFGYGHWMKLRRAKREAAYRQGLVSYRDREFKFI